MRRPLQLLLMSTIAALFSNESATADHERASAEDIQHLLAAKCLSCHGPEKQEGNLRLDSLAAAEQGGDRGTAVVPGEVEKSLLVTAITFSDPDLQMPPKQKLSDHEIALLTDWIKDGAVWPEPVAVLFEDQSEFLAALGSGTGEGRLVQEGTFAGSTALGITPLQRDGVKIPGWNFEIRDQPTTGEYRFLRLAWKKRGEGSVMIELAADGTWPDAKAARGRYVAGPNTTGWAAISVSDETPTEWTVQTFDLWRDIGDFTLTGIAPTCDRGEEAFFDSIILGPTVASLDAYQRGVIGNPIDSSPVGDAFTDQRNPIRKIFHGERLDLWSLRKPQETNISFNRSPPTPAPVSGAPIATNIDAFALPSNERPPEADRRTLIRRLTFDLTGLPPNYDDVQAFVANDDPDAYEKLVERLLASPHYGERQARLWLDVVRYADTNGYERDEFRPLAWQYRDYVIRSFNQDKPFDQFIREQLAGDELVDGVPKSPADAEMLIATGYLRLGQWDSTASIFQEEPRLRAEMMADLTNTTASAFLGLTISCCQCHDHKYDPLTQADHYRFRAFFAGVTPHDNLTISVADELADIEQHNAKLDEQITRLKAEQAELHESCKERHDALTTELADIASQKRTPRGAMGATDSGSTVPATHVFYQGDFSSPREAVEPGFVSIFSPEPAAIEPPRDNTTGRRLTLAKWIASPENPWTARVIVNRIWQQHFGTGIVATPNDFGFSGARPAHPELLDWLAVEFMNRGWSIKELHRMIALSEVYRQKSGVGFQPARSEGANAQAHDKQDAYPAAVIQSIRRLDAETLRDSLLAVSGLLKLHDTGKSLWPTVPDELLVAQPAILEAIEGKDGGRMQGWYADSTEDTHVRSVFLVRKRCLPIPFLQAFDLPDTTVSCARRDTTVVAPQALMLLNSPEGVRYARALADLLYGDAKLDFDDVASTRELVDLLFRRTLARDAWDHEQTLAMEFLKRHRDHYAKSRAVDDGEKLAFTDLCRAVLNLNEFVYID